MYLTKFSIVWPNQGGWVKWLEIVCSCFRSKVPIFSPRSSGVALAGPQSGWAGRTQLCGGGRLGEIGGQKSEK